MKFLDTSVNRISIAALRPARHSVLYWASRIQRKFSNAVSFKSVSINYAYVSQVISPLLVHSVHILTCVLHIPLISLALIYQPNSIYWRVIIVKELTTLFSLLPCQEAKSFFYVSCSRISINFLYLPTDKTKIDTHTKQVVKLFSISALL
jgi:hypothetical protein